MDDAEIDEATRAWLLSCVPTPPPSPERAKPAPEFPALTLEFPRAGVAQASGSQIEKADDDGFSKWERSKPYFDTMKQAEGSLSVEKVYTAHGGRFNCLAFAYLVAGGQMEKNKQRSA